MRPCPDPKCHYKTNNPGQYQAHLRTTGHDRTSARKKEFKGHLAVRKKKSKS
ncbi:MAG: hypothetical protein QY323_03785 [Patescibacteria group bacterium]|nr:MAG: hypothetical protein QY323_03785 [Patescibacteria group bacterium]